MFAAFKKNIIYVDRIEEKQKDAYFKVNPI